MKSGFQLFDAEPQPCLVLSRDSTMLAFNGAAGSLCERLGGVDVLALLPVNREALVRASLTQKRALQDIESRVGDSILLWTFVPDVESATVLARGRVATDEIRLLDRARTSDRLYRLIIENTTDLISRHSPDWCFIDASPASRRLLGYWPEELRGKRFEEVFSGASERQLAEAYLSLQEQGYATLTLNVIHPGGGKRWFEIASRAIRETYTGDVVEVVSVTRDITARVESEAQNRRLADELAHSARLATIGELASGIAHEMNQPLASIVNFASASQRYLQQARQDSACIERVDEGLQRIIHYANRAAEVIKRLRAFLRKGQQSIGPVRLNALIANVARLCQWDAEKHAVLLEQRLPESSLEINADPVLLEQVLINLIRNGIDAIVEARETENDSSRSRLVVSAHRNEAGETLIEVTDQGCGLDESGIRQMFTPFYTSKPQGLGLGLSMSRSIIEGFGGFLDAVPAETGGLTLVCRFPPGAVPRQGQVNTGASDSDD
ncbi:MAG: PAS domain S-box protein [Oceanospirillaceae bacterium]|nr:PAS domain S-box protein [Oceanospirillaceae bacterium]